MGKALDKLRLMPGTTLLLLTSLALSLFPPAADSDSFADGRFMACFGKIYVTFL